MGRIAGRAGVGIESVNLEQPQWRRLGHLLQRCISVSCYADLIGVAELVGAGYHHAFAGLQAIEYFDR